MGLKEIVRFDPYLEVDYIAPIKIIVSIQNIFVKL